MQSEDLKQALRQEYIKCGEDPSYFIRKYCVIQHPIRGKIPFELYPFQVDTLKEVLNHKYNIILKARQLGISTLTAAYSLWLMTFRNDKNILVLATKQDTAKNLVTKIRVMHSNLPGWLRQTCIEDNKLSLRYKNGSQVKAVSSSEDSGRSEALSLLVLDEAAFIDKIDTIWAAAQQTLSTGGQCIALSTPNGVGNWFHRTWVGAEENDNGFYPIKLHWTVHPERDKSYRAAQDKLLGPGLAAQECDCDFLTSGQMVVDGSILQEYKDNQCREPMMKQGIDSNVWIWEAPDYNKNYIMSADVSRGDGSDYSAFHILDVESMEQVAEYRGKISTKDFGNLCVNVATEFNDALLVVENNNIGWATIQQVIDRGYQNLFYSSQDLQYVDVEHQITNKFRAQDRNLKPGFSMTMKTRPLVIAKLEEYFREKAVIVHSNRLIDELFVFIYNNNKAQAMSGYNDDLVMSYGIALWVRDTALRLRAEGIELSKKTMSNFSTPNQLMYTPGGKEDAWRIEIGPNKENEDIKWLL